MLGPKVVPMQRTAVVKHNNEMKSDFFVVTRRLESALSLAVNVSNLCDTSKI